MKRSRSQASREMSPGVNNESFLHVPKGDEVFGLGETNRVGKEDDVSHVIVAGAGPAGLMLAYGLLEAHKDCVY
jgi:NADPH-dependent 2,4-dienoyl-CoA reductase/sulfur reductase-like enzyme